jgi:predicted esterase
VHFRVTGLGADTAIEWEQTSSGSSSRIELRHGATPDRLEGGGTAGDGTRLASPVVLRKDATDAVVYRDYEAHLADLGITWRSHDDPALAAFGDGSLVHLPPQYGEDSTKTWPLIVFLHGSGDRGENGLVIAQNSPFRFVTAGGALDAIVVAPLLREDQDSFPEAYLDGVLDDSLDRYRVDRTNVTVTGLSMGGEATYRLARHRSDVFAAAAILCGFETGTFPEAYRWGYKAITEPRSEMADVPALVIHGRDDTIVPLEAAAAAVEALRKDGVEVRFDVLEDHDHDVWTTSYSDPAFYEWLLGQRREPPS